MPVFSDKAVMLKLHKSVVGLTISTTDMLNSISVFFTVTTVKKTAHGESVELKHYDYVSVKGPQKKFLSDTHVTKSTKRKAIKAILKTLKDLEPTADFIIAVTKALDY
jgi:hypothetical protein